MDAAEAEDFAAFAKLRLVDNGYAVIRKFTGKSSFGTYVTTVVARLLNEYRDQEWGRWRSSAEAKRLGPLAVDIERLVVRDARSANDAFEIIAASYPELTREEFDVIVARLPARHRIRMVNLDEAASVLQKPDVAVDNRENAEHLSAIVAAYIDALPEEDQLLFRLRFEADMPVPQIARALHLDAQLLYRRLRRHFEDLRNVLTAKGISAGEVSELIGGDTALLDFHLKGRDIDSLNEEYDTRSHTSPKKP